MYNKKYEELTFSDNSMFGCVVKDEEYSRGLLSCLLQRPIGELQDLHREHAIKCYADGKGIQLDLYSKEQDIVYDAEMQLERRVKGLRRNEELRSDYMKELVLAMDYKEEGREEGREEERANTEREKQRADIAEQKAKISLKRADAAEAELAELKKELEALKSQILLLSKQQ